jgi:hypothetical protein
VYNWPHNKKLLKLAIYSACQVIAFMQLLENKDHDSLFQHRSVQLVCSKILNFERSSVCCAAHFCR